MSSLNSNNPSINVTTRQDVLLNSSTISSHSLDESASQTLSKFINRELKKIEKLLLNYAEQNLSEKKLKADKIASTVIEKLEYFKENYPLVYAEHVANLAVVYAKMAQVDESNNYCNDLLDNLVKSNLINTEEATSIILNKVLLCYQINFEHEKIIHYADLILENSELYHDPIYITLASLNKAYAYNYLKELDLANQSLHNAKKLLLDLYPNLSAISSLQYLSDVYYELGYWQDLKDISEFAIKILNQNQSYAEAKLFFNQKLYLANHELCLFQEADLAIDFCLSYLSNFKKDKNHRNEFYHFVLAKAQNMIELGKFSDAERYVFNQIQKVENNKSYRSIDENLNIINLKNCYVEILSKLTFLTAALDIAKEAKDSLLLLLPRELLDIYKSEGTDTLGLRLKGYVENLTNNGDNTGLKKLYTLWKHQTSVSTLNHNLNNLELYFDQSYLAYVLGSYIFQTDKKHFIENNLKFLKACAQTNRTDLFYSVKNNLYELDDLDAKTILYSLTLETQLFVISDDIESASTVFEKARELYPKIDRLGLKENLKYKLTEYDLALARQDASDENATTYFHIAKKLFSFLEKYELHYTQLAALISHQIHQIASNIGDESMSYYYHNKYDSIITILEIEN